MCSCVCIPVCVWLVCGALCVCIPAPVCVCVFVCVHPPCVQADSRPPAVDSQEDDSKSLADSVLSTASSIRQVHSRKSIATVIDRMKRGGGLGTIGEEVAHLAPLPKVPPPVIATVDDSAHALADKKKLVSQLAFLNRNPSV